MAYPVLVQDLIRLLSQLPSVGPKTAERYVFYLLEQKPELIEPLAQHLQQLGQALKTCSICGAISLTEKCNICEDKQRQDQIICIVATNQDLEAIESTGNYPGRYFVLGGYLDTLNDIKPEDLRFEALLNHLRTHSAIEELILAFDPTIEGETTALYLSKLLEKWPGKISRLARGLSSGANLEYADPLTLANALKFRQILK
ncbi:MAG TPA: recombination mediator RecR [bacterium]|nr:recombination mediator RecR [bacterium]